MGTAYVCLSGFLSSDLGFPEPCNEPSLRFLFLFSISTDLQLPGCRCVSKDQSQVLFSVFYAVVTSPSPSEDLWADPAPDSQLFCGYFPRNTQWASLHMGRCEQSCNIFLGSVLPKTGPSSGQFSHDSVTSQLVVHPVSPDHGVLLIVSARSSPATSDMPIRPSHWTSGKQMQPLPRVDCPTSTNPLLGSCSHIIYPHHGFPLSTPPRSSLLLPSRSTHILSFIRNKQASKK